MKEDDINIQNVIRETSEKIDNMVWGALYICGFDKDYINHHVEEFYANKETTYSTSSSIVNELWYHEDELLFSITIKYIYEEKIKVTIQLEILHSGA